MPQIPGLVFAHPITLPPSSVACTSGHLWGVVVWWRPLSGSCWGSAFLTVATLPAAETPIEEFTPTPAFPALQYLESVDVEGVAWRAGLRTGDFLIEVRPVLTSVTWGDGAVLSLSPRRSHLACPTCPPVCPQVNGVNVVKVGHKQVVALIRQGGNRLVMKVVSVTRKPEEDGARRRGEGSGFRPLPTVSPQAADLSLLLPGPYHCLPSLTPDC